MPNDKITFQVTIDRKELISLLGKGKFFEAEQLIKDKSKDEIKKVWKRTLEYYVSRRETRDLANTIAKNNNYLSICLVL